MAYRLRAECYRTDEASSLAAEGLALEILAGLLRSTGERPDPAWLSRAIQVVHDNFSGRLTLSEIANAVAVHPVYLAAFFRKRFGITVGSYIRELRIRTACRDLERREKPLAEIALDAGFANQAHFSRTFKKVLGVTPGAYRDQFSRLKRRQTSFRSGKISGTKLS